jgi:O-antigen/teichoic acid export membrane protein
VLTVGANVSSQLAAQQCYRSSLRSDFSWTFLGNGVYAVGQWMTLVLLAKLSRPEVVGQYALGFAIAAPAFMFAGLQLRVVLVSDVYQKTYFGHYLSLRLFSTAIALLIILGTAQMLGFRGQLRWTILMVGLAQAVEAVSDIYYARLQLHNRMVRIAKSMIARTMLSALGLTIGVSLDGSLVWGLVGIVLARTIVLLGYDIREDTHEVAWQARDFVRQAALEPRWDPRVLLQLVWSALPLSIIAALVSLNFNIPRYFLEHSLGERALGFFSAIALISATGSMAVVSLGQSAFARLARCYAAGNFAEFRSLLGKLLAMGAALGICGIALASVAGRQILNILFRPEYAGRADLLPWMMAVGCVGYIAQFLGFGMTAARCYHSQVVLFALTNLVVAGGSHLLIPRLGLLGAILAMLIATIIQVAGSIVILVRGMRRQARLCAQDVETLSADILVQA